MSQSKERRKQQLLELLAQEEMIHISELASFLSISEMTVRRYVAELKGVVRLLGSYAMLQADPQSGNNTYFVDLELDRNIEKKERIGKCAASLVKPNDVIFIDCGTTTPFIAQNIDNNIYFEGVCCSLNIFTILNGKKKSKILLTGGSFHEKTQVFCCRQAIEMIRDLRITKAFISAAGISRELGLTCFNQYETELKREVMNVSQHVYVVADSSKFSNVKMAYFGGVEQVDTIITNSEIACADEEWVDSMDIKLVKV